MPNDKTADRSEKDRDGLEGLPRGIWTLFRKKNAPVR